MFNELLKNVMNLGIITEDDVKRLTAVELMLLIIERSNGLLQYLNSYVQDTDQRLVALDEKYQKITDEIKKLIKDNETYFNEIIRDNLENLAIEQLNAWLTDGTLESIINQLLFDEIKTQVDTIQEDLDTIKSNPKYMLELYVGDAGRQTTEYVRNHITRGKKAGFKDICILIYLESDGTTLEDVNRFEEYNQIANEIGMKIKVLKLHGSYKYPNYLSTLYDAISKLPDVDTVFIFNEQFKTVYEAGMNHPDLIKENCPQVKKVGCTVDYGTAFKDWNPTIADSVEQLQTKYDILGVHMYPSCGSFSEARHTSYEQCIQAFNEFELLIHWKKELWITESGVLPYWQFLELPESYTVSNLTDLERTIDGQRLFYRALLNCKMAQQAEIIIPWYTESWNYDDTIEMWDVIGHIIKNS